MVGGSAERGLTPFAVVAGAHGAIGQEVARQLREAGWRVAGIGHGPGVWAGETPIDRWLAGEISPLALDRLIDGIGPPDLILNLAGGASVAASVRDPARDFHRTVSMTVTLLDFIKNRAPRARLVAVSSAAVYGGGHAGPIPEDAELNPISAYGHHKHLMEQTVAFWGRAYGVSSVIVRLFSVYGVGLRKQMIFDLCSRLAAAPEKLVIWGSGAETRDWLAIQDAARLLLEVVPLATPDAPIYNGCTGEARRVADVAGLLGEAWGLNTKISFDGVVRPGDPQHLVGSVERLKTVPFEPRVSLEEGVLAVVADARSRSEPSNS